MGAGAARAILPAPHTQGPTATALPGLQRHAAGKKGFDLCTALNAKAIQSSQPLAESGAVVQHMLVPHG